MGGIGKTELALEWFYQNSHRFSSAFWVDASGPAQLAQAYDNMSERLGLLPKGEKKGLVDSRTVVADWFQEANTTWLVCFDGVRDAKLLHTYWPRGRCGKVLITTRNDNLETEQSWKTHSITLQGLSRVHAVQLFTRAGGYDMDCLFDGHQETVVHWLQYVPLAIDHMGGIIDKQHLSLPTFMRFFTLKYYAWSRQDMRGEQTPWRKDRCRYGKPLAQAWPLHDMDPDSLHLLRLLACFNGDTPASWLVRCKGVPDTSLLFQDQDALEEAWTGIRNSSTIFPGPFTNQLSVHSLIRRHVGVSISPADWVVYASAVVDGQSSTLNRLNKNDKKHQIGHSTARMELFQHMQNTHKWFIDLWRTQLHRYKIPLPRKTFFQLARLYTEIGM